MYIEYGAELKALYQKHSIDAVKPKYCSGFQHCEYRPVTYTDYTPHYTPYTITNHIVGSTQWTIKPGVHLYAQYSILYTLICPLYCLHRTQ